MHLWCPRKSTNNVHNIKFQVTPLAPDVHAQLLRRIHQLEHQNKILKCRASSSKRKCEQLEAGLKRVFNPDQIQALSRQSNRGCKWSKETIKESLQLCFACDATGYDMLRSRSLPLPAARTLRQRIQGYNKQYTFIASFQFEYICIPI